ncbi:MAG: DNA topoisomerase IV subunit A [Magnetovibrio sp.]|nr:DNA topoisomerase IV subunit A [Magnetovibrio sp.]
MSKPAPVEEIREARLADALSERYLSYALSTIMSRSLPDVRDGLKPVHRRLLYAMQQLKLAPETGFKKCARVVGDVIGKYHPHGDASVYDALVRLAQVFAQRYPLVDGQGNFGNIDGDNAAAMRYTESRMTAIATALLDGIEQDTVDFRETYDGEEEEPLVLPARFPNLLANGAAGIAVGMATSVPPHNVGELCDALIHLIKFPNVRFDKLFNLIPGPDFPTGGVLVETNENIISAYKTGRGSFRLRARWEREQLPHRQYQIVITEIPYQVQKSRLIEKVADLLNARKLPMLSDIRDESAEDIRIVLEPKNRDVDADLLMEHLFRQTDLETRVSMNMNVLDANNTPGVMNLREALQAFLDHRHDVLIRQTKYRLGKIEHRLEVLGGLLTAYLNLDEVIQIIREHDDAKKHLIETFKLTEVQADAILNMRLRQLRKLEEMEIEKENVDLTKENKELNALLKNEKNRWKTIADEVTEIKKNFGKKTELGKRRTTIGKAPTAVIVPLEAIIEKEPITIIYSEKGWVRTAKGHLDDTSQLKFKEGDRLQFALKAETTDKLIAFATNGRFYTIGADKLPGGRGHGEPIRLMIDLPNGDDIIDMFIFEGGRRILVASDAGRGFVIQEDDVLAHTKNGKQALNLKPGQEAQAMAFIGHDHDHVAVIGTKRKLLIFPLEELPEMGRGAGVILQKYSQGGLSDITTLKLKEGLEWRTGAGNRTEPKIKSWVGKRAQAGLLPFKGFPKASRFK